ncbi:MFS transporter [Cellulomonas dongxiuzhuiae]|uniref:MFS transporter n=1 Tax=Cellulomonas dongxiuzhuiae TaxID=2819979 RepID=A0ABX8GIS0_9CELL|nr:MFS transporter [Cellulomonas dongxiuzhuiae]MBO3087878.1 MFS transporter [Cellulomonas dongxiuzhuiae]MBO3094773.1 MFS transporter [Cellulomonas dongxiuzhuiae]QWC15767.1 MFS transporter [Cellulomonas dongxiuzhuiae]
MRSLLVDLTPVRVSPAFRGLWLGLSVANLGSQLTVVAVGLQVYALTASTLAVGVLGMCALVPLVVFGLYGGALVDHYDRRTVAVVASVVSWVAVLALVGQAAVGNEHVGVLYALVAVQSAAGAVNSPARSAIIPRLLEPRLMPAANALQTMGWNVALTLGPLAGAALVAGIGYVWAYAVDAVLFTFALTALLRLPPVPPEPSDDRRQRLGLGSVVDGLRYLGTQPNVRMTFLVDIVAMVTAMPRVLFPAVGVLYLGGGETTTGVLTAAIAAGGILAGLFSGGLARVRWQGRVIAGAITAWGLSIVAFGLVLVTAGRTTPDGVLPLALALAVVTLALAGASDAVSSVFRQTILQTATPDHMRGRLQGVFVVVVAGGPRLGELVLGALSTRVGEAGAAVIGGVACVVLLWVLVRAQRTFWHYDARHPTP